MRRGVRFAGKVSLFVAMFALMQARPQGKQQNRPRSRNFSSFFQAALMKQRFAITNPAARQQRSSRVFR